jgi:hypothetical protein
METLFSSTAYFLAGEVGRAISSGGVAARKVEAALQPEIQE